MHDPYLSHTSMMRPNFRTAAQRYLKQNFHAQNRSSNPTIITLEFYVGLHVCKKVCFFYVDIRNPTSILDAGIGPQTEDITGRGDSKGSLKYEADHIQRLFLKTLETGFLDENIRVRLRPYLSDHQIADEDLIYQVNSVVSSEAERDRKLKLQSQGRSPRVFQVDAELEGRTGKRTQPVPGRELHLPTQDQTISAIQGLKAEVEALRAEVQKRAYTNPPSTLSSNHNYQASPRQQVPAHDENWEGRRVERGSQGPRMERSSQGQRQFKCSVCQDKGEEKCIHCFICGGDNHHMSHGCRQPRPVKPESAASMGQEVAETPNEFHPCSYCGMLLEVDNNGEPGVREVDLKKAQEMDPAINRVAQLVMTGKRPSTHKVKEETRTVQRLLYEWDKLAIGKDGVSCIVE
ncbi:hypothetical protein QZH41_007367 [Actinostola sp. cb2023]|nr:hypothetical protein QZH41_007367 [Actinostola sp. cb2023]